MSIVQTAVISAAAAAASAHASEVYSLDFESAGGYTTSVAEFSDGSTDYFLRTNGAGIASSVNYHNADGSFFAGQDIDGEGAGLPVSLTTSTFSIAGFNTLRFYVDLAEDAAGDGNQDWDAPDFVRFEYAVDGGAWEEIFTAGNDGSTFNAAALVNGTAITDVFATFQADLAGVTGSTMAIRVVWSLDAGDEDLAIDNIRITGQPIAVVPLPPAAWAGLGTLALIAGARAARRR
jgi:hypothetical protein